MKKIVTFLIVLVATATASASPYNTELLADPSFEASELGGWGNFYWGEDGSTDTFVSNDNTTGYFESGTQVDDGLFSIKISYDAGATPAWPEDGFGLDRPRNSGSIHTSPEGVSFTGTGSENVSYLAGDTLTASLRVYVDQWDANSNGLGFRIVGSNGVIATSSFVSSPTGSWQTVSLNHEFSSDYTGWLDFQPRYHFDNSGSGTASTAWIDNASMKVIPEPSTLMTFVLGAMILFRLAKSRRKD